MPLSPEGPAAASAEVLPPLEPILGGGKALLGAGGHGSRVDFIPLSLLGQELEMSQKHKKLLQRQGEIQNKVKRGETITETTVKKHDIKLNAHSKEVILESFQHACRYVSNHYLHREGQEPSKLQGFIQFKRFNYSTAADVIMKHLIKLLFQFKQLTKSQEIDVSLSICHHTLFPSENVYENCILENPPVLSFILTPLDLVEEQKHKRCRVSTTIHHTALRKN
ncbi:hypothetical protein Anapl_07644 [Anas platyrhynchos]|uniref:Uncharacterized protein n=1 Tax=Anas platyrhynchos TaxID=8839 RepID=R0KBT7_ANAPL|nr:hypothetical protein Anapl_07644 [Anas platyrhynchos]